MANLNVSVPAASKSKSLFTLLLPVSSKSAYHLNCSSGFRGGGGVGEAQKPGRLRKSSPWAHAKSICRWGKGRPARRQRSLFVASSSSSSDSQSEENFWEQEEGKKKLGEIEDMKELISEARKLQEASPSSQQEQQVNMPANEASGEPD